MNNVSDWFLLTEISVSFGNQLGFLQESPGSWEDILWFGNALVVLVEHVSTKVYGIQTELQGDTI